MFFVCVLTLQFNDNALVSPAFHPRSAAVFLHYRITPLDSAVALYFQLNMKSRSVLWPIYTVKQYVLKCNTC